MLISFILRLFPLKFVQRSGKLFGLLFLYILPSRKKVAMNNLTLCFPEEDEKWKRGVVKGVFINLGITLFELLYIPRMKKRLLDKFVSINNYHLVDEALRKRKGVFFLSGHISNWEIMAFSYGKIFRRKLNIIVKSQTNNLVNNKVNEFRELGGNRIIEVGSSLREIYSIVKENGIVCFLMDQSANPDYSVYSNFFGQNVATFSGPAKMALKFNTELIFAYPVRQKKYNYLIKVGKINFDDLQGGATDENVQNLTDRINQRLEAAIRENPEQWLWIHRRFKHIKQ